MITALLGVYTLVALVIIVGYLMFSGEIVQQNEIGPSIGVVIAVGTFWPLAIVIAVIYHLVTGRR